MVGVSLSGTNMVIEMESMHMINGVDIPLLEAGVLSLHGISTGLAVGGEGINHSTSVDVLGNGSQLPGWKISVLPELFIVRINILCVVHELVS